MKKIGHANGRHLGKPIRGCQDENPRPQEATIALWSRNEVVLIDRPMTTNTLVVRWPLLRPLSFPGQDVFSGHSVWD